MSAQLCTCETTCANTAKLFLLQTAGGKHSSSSVNTPPDRLRRHLRNNGQHLCEGVAFFGLLRSVRCLHSEPLRADMFYMYSRIFVLLFHIPFKNQTKRRGSEVNGCFTDACRLFIRLTHHQYVEFSTCCYFLEISKTGRTLSSAEHGECEASGLPGQRTVRII